MSLAVFLDLDGVLTPKAVNLQFANMLGVESQLIEFEDQYANGQINNAEFNAKFVPLFRDAGFSEEFAKKHFSDIIFSSYAEELLQANIAHTYIVTSSPSYFVEQFARKYNIPLKHVICSRYVFDNKGLISTCEKACGMQEKAKFVRQLANKYRVSIGVGDSPAQDGGFMSECSVRILLGGERRNYLHANDLFAVHNLVRLIQDLVTSDSATPTTIQRGVELLLTQSPYERNIFIMTPFMFKSDARYSLTVETLKQELAKFGYRGWTADDQDLDQNLWVNVRSFMHACKYGVALLTAEEVQKGNTTVARPDVYNPNVIVEAGYMLGQDKDVAILIDNRMMMPTDLKGQLFHPINFSHSAPEVCEAVKRWSEQWDRISALV